MDIVIEVGEKFGLGYGVINAGENNKSDAEVLAQTAGEHLVPVTRETLSCCIDGRGCSECLDGSRSAPRPSVAGGAGTTSYAAAELTGWFGNEDEDDMAVSKRFKTVLETLRSEGLTPGNHCDRSSYETDFRDGESGAPKTGCGANDKLPMIIKTLYDNIDAVSSLVEALLPDEFHAIDKQLISETKATTQVTAWNPVSSMQATVAGSGSDAIEILESVHAERLVIFNYVSARTVDRDALLAATEKQVFVVDMWYVRELARAMAKDRQNEEDWTRKLLYAMTAYQVATYLTLCDGSQRPVFLRNT